MHIATYFYSHTKQGVLDSTLYDKVCIRLATGLVLSR